MNTDTPKAVAKPVDHFMVLSDAGRMVVSIKYPDGSVQFGEGATQDQASRMFWEHLGHFIALKIRDLAGGDETPVAWMWQHEETGNVGFVDQWQVENGWQAANPRNKIVSPLFTRPTPAAAAGVPTLTDEQILAANYEFGVEPIICEADADIIRFARAVLSAGAPAVPLQDEQDSSSSVHLAADGSSRALRAASQDAPLAWQPIETAPKDGRAILLGARGGAWIGKYLAVYTSGYVPENPWSTLMLNHDHMGEKWQKPTHWMPLPPPPVQCDGRDGVTGSGASSEAAEGTPSSSGSDGHGKDCA